MATPVSFHLTRNFDDGKVSVNSAPAAAADQSGNCSGSAPVRSTRRRRAVNTMSSPPYCRW